jgi:hypothetical protein
MYLMIRILDYPTLNKKQSVDFILLGISIGLCIMSKMHGIFLWLGFGAYIIFHRRDLLKLPMLWISGIISMGIIYPIYYWNQLNHFITYNYHQGRIRFLGSSPDLDRILQQVLGSFFYSNPVNFIIYIITIWAIIKGKINRLPVVYPFTWLSLPLILVLFWTLCSVKPCPIGPAPHISLMLLAACWLDEKTENRAFTKWLRIAAWLYVGVIIIGVSGIHFPLPDSALIKRIWAKDITLDMYGWHSFAVRSILIPG